MKILLVTAPFVSLREPYNGGTEAFVVDLANELRARGHEVDVFAKDTDERNLFHIISAKRSPLNMESTVYDDALGQQYYMTFTFGLMDMSEYDVIHYNSYVPEIYEVAALFNKPSLLTLHLGVNKRLGKAYELFCKRTDVIPISISQRIHDDWAPNLKTDTPIIHNGVNLDRWPLRKKTPTDGYLLWTGRINADKNPEAAIKLAQHLKRPLKMVGKIYDQTYFNERIKPHLSDTIQYVGHLSQSEISELTTAASMYLATAQWNEPFGLSILEMLASGLPVVGFTSAIPPELRFADVSIAVDSTDWKDLINPAEKALGTVPSKCREFASTFSIQKMAAAYEGLYSELSR